MNRVKLFLFLFFTVLSASVYLPVLLLFFPWRLSLGPLLLQFYCKISLIIFRVKLDCRDKIDKKIFKEKGVIFISNHISSLDIFVLSALFRNIFVSKIEVKHYPVIGQIAWLLGIIFLERSSPEERHRILRVIAEESRKRIIAIFPQGTTSSPADPLPFKRGIFKTIEMDNAISIIPVSIYYREYGEIVWKEYRLIDNVKNVCAQNRIHVKINIFEKITIDDFRDKTIPEICTMVENKILSEGRKHI